MYRFHLYPFIQILEDSDNSTIQLQIQADNGYSQQVLSVSISNNQSQVNYSRWLVFLLFSVIVFVISTLFSLCQTKFGNPSINQILKSKINAQRDSFKVLKQHHLTKKRKKGVFRITMNRKKSGIVDRDTADFPNRPQSFHQEVNVNLSMAKSENSLGNRRTFEDKKLKVEEEKLSTKNAIPNLKVQNISVSDTNNDDETSELIPKSLSQRS